MSRRDREIEALLPLPLATFHISMSLGDGERHGYAIIQDVAARTNGELKLSAGTLYRSIQRMQDQGLIVESKRRPATAQDTSGAGTTGSRRSARVWRMRSRHGWRSW